MEPTHAPARCTHTALTLHTHCPDFANFGPQLSLYMSLAPEQKLTYPLAGPAGPAAFESGKAGFEARNFRGLGVFESSPYEVSDGAPCRCAAHPGPRA